MAEKDMIKEKARSFIMENAIMVPRDAVEEFYSQIIKLSGFGAGALLSYSGKKVGHVISKHIRLILQKDNPYLEEILWTIKAVMLESFFCRDMDFEIKEENLVIIKLRGSVLAEAVESSNKPICIPLAGAFSGGVEVLTGKSWECKELECQAQGKEFCLFELKAK